MKVWSIRIACRLWPSSHEYEIFSGLARVQCSLKLTNIDNVRRKQASTLVTSVTNNPNLAFDKITTFPLVRYHIKDIDNCTFCTKQS